MALRVTAAAIVSEYTEATQLCPCEVGDESCRRVRITGPCPHPGSDHSFHDCHKRGWHGTGAVTFSRGGIHSNGSGATGRFVAQTTPGLYVPSFAGYCLDHPELALARIEVDCGARLHVLRPDDLHQPDRKHRLL